MSNDRPGEMAASMGNAVEGLPSLLEDTEVQKDIGKNNISLSRPWISLAVYLDFRIFSRFYLIYTDQTSRTSLFGSLEALSTTTKKIQNTTIKLPNASKIY